MDGWMDGWTGWIQLRSLVQLGHLAVLKIGSTRFASIWGLLWRNPKGFLILTTFRGVHKSFPFGTFLHCRFSLSLYFARQSGGWVKIYNVKKVKMEMTCAPQKTYQTQNQNQSSPQILVEQVEPIFHQIFFFFVKHPNEGIHMFSVVIIQPIYNAIQLSHWSSQWLSWLVQPWLVIRTYLKNYFTTLAFEMDDSNSRFRCTIVLPAHWLVSAFFMLLSWLYDTWCQTPF